MGGGDTPREVVRGVAEAAKSHPDVRFFLVGRQDSVGEEWNRLGAPASNVQVVLAEQVVAADESPVEALREKKGSSIEVAARLLRSGEASALVSAGSTGAVVAAGAIFLGLLPGVRRAAVAAGLPAGVRAVLLIDAGANIASTAEHLIQYGVMGSTYARVVLQMESPRVGLLSFGGEAEETDSPLQRARGAFRQSKLNFVGDVEGAAVFGGACDVLVCDGFVGKIVLGVFEGLSAELVEFAKALLLEALRTAELPVPVRERLESARRGSAVLLGVNGVAILASGGGGPKAIEDAVSLARRMVETDVTRRIMEEIHASSEWT